MNMTPQLKETQQKLLEIASKIKKNSESLSGKNLDAKEKLFECADEIKKAVDEIEQVINFTYFGQKSGGQRKSMKKTEAVRENGKKGGRPSSKIVTKIEKSENNEIYTVTFNDKSTKTVSGKTLHAVREAFPPTRYKWSPEMEEAWERVK